MVEQGDIIKIEGIDRTALVVSKNLYNECGHCIVCPVIIGPSLTTFSFPVKEDEYVLCDNPRQFDLTSRGYTVINRISLAGLIQIIDRLQSLFDYF
ncbi:MAG: type II toxin-antitoxin system PemK/MazF family toxin [Lachnospiraceae bacterium]|nr:type II toxin-antitoxin system PemK/MazF family toxin [Lachnospiraceae bacterium]